MNDQLTISREDSEAIFAALRGIGWTLRHLVVKRRDDEGALYAIWSNLDSIRLHLNKSGEGKSATRN